MRAIMCVWPDQDQWVVSRDVVDDDYGNDNNTGAISSETLTVCAEQEAGIAIARDRFLAVYVHDEHGNPSLIQPA